MPACDTTPSVSIVVPVYGTEDYLEDCLTSVLGQSLHDIEVIVVDDHSPGDVESIVTRIANHDPRVRFVRHDTNKGLMQARLTGARMARAGYLGFVDSDDTIENRHVEALHSAAIRYDAELVTCALTITDMAESTGTRNRWDNEHQRSGDDIMHSLLAGGMLNHMGTKLIGTVTWQSAMSRLDDRWTTISFAEDLLLTFLIAEETTCYAHVPNAGYRYIRRADSITTAPGADKVINRLNDLARVYDALRSLLVERPMPPAYTTAFFEREFAVVVDELLGELTAGDTRTSRPVPLASLDLLDAVVTGRSSPWDPPPTPSDHTTGDLARCRVQCEVDRAQFVLHAAGLAGVEPLGGGHVSEACGKHRDVADSERRLAEVEAKLAAREAEIAELACWREAVERSRVHRTFLAMIAVYDLPIIGSALRRLRRMTSNIVGVLPRLGRS